MYVKHVTAISVVRFCINIFISIITVPSSYSQVVLQHIAKGKNTPVATHYTSVSLDTIYRLCTKLGGGSIPLAPLYTEL